MPAGSGQVSKAKHTGRCRRAARLKTGAGVSGASTLISRPSLTVWHCSSSTALPFPTLFTPACAAFFRNLNSDSLFQDSLVAVD